MGSITLPSSEQDLDILIIGGGLSGCYSLWKLRQLKPTPSIKVIEAGSEFGGVWHWNRYPGARVDSEWPYYQFSIPEVWQGWHSESRFPDHNQVRAYIKHMDDVLDLKRDTLFNTVVDGIHWDNQAKKWKTRTKDGRVFNSHYLLICTGSSYKRHFPDFEGLHTFRGQLLHSSSFSAGEARFDGKRVGVIGAGSTGVQIIQEVSKQDCQLINFIRTPNMALPMKQRSISKAEEDELKSKYADIFKSLRRSRTGLGFKPSPGAFTDFSNKERDEILEGMWNQGGFAFSQSTFREFLFDEETNDYLYNFWAKKVRARITDPEKRETMAPIPKKNYWGTKRPSLEQDYYESIDRPNVKLVNLKKSPIQKITESGVVTEDGNLYEVDVLILATGFDALNGSQKALNIHDRHGVNLRDRWAKGTETYLGITIPGYPNAFMSYGPGGPAALGNAPPIIETAVDWIAEVMQRMEDEGIETIDTQPEVAKRWRQDIQDMNDKTFLAKEDSWWVGANVPGKQREQLNYLGGLEKYGDEIQNVLDGWKGFVLEKRTPVA